jgi:hypothetical protein
MALQLDWRAVLSLGAPEPVRARKVARVPGYGQGAAGSERAGGRFHKMKGKANEDRSVGAEARLGDGLPKGH